MTTRLTVLAALTMMFGLASTPVDAQCGSGYRRPIYVQKPVPLQRIAFRPAQPVPTYDSIAALPAVPSCSVFGGCTHVDDYAVRLQVIMHELCLDTYFNYSHNPGFREAYSDAYSLYQLAKGIHDSAYLRNYDSMRAQLAGADVILYRLKTAVKGWTRYPQRQVGTLGMITKLGMAEDTLNLLMRDLGVNVNPLAQRALPEVPPAPDQLGLPAAPPLPQALPAPGFNPSSVQDAPEPLPFN